MVLIKLGDSIYLLSIQLHRYDFIMIKCEKGVDQSTSVFWATCIYVLHAWLHRVGELMGTTAPCLLYNSVHSPGTYMSAHVVLPRPLLINLQPRKKERNKRKEKREGRSWYQQIKRFVFTYVTFATLIYVLADSFNFGHFHACMHEGLLLLQRFTPRLCSVPPNFPNFVSHQNHIEILNIANDACMEH